MFCTKSDVISDIARIDFPFMGFLPSVQTVPLLFFPDDDSYRKAALSTTVDLGERCKDPQRVLGRAPADIIVWVGASDPILTLSQLRGSEDPQPQNFFWTLYMQFYMCFGALLKLTINNYRKI